MGVLTPIFSVNSSLSCPGGLPLPHPSGPNLPALIAGTNLDNGIGLDHQSFAQLWSTASNALEAFTSSVWTWPPGSTMDTVQSFISDLYNCFLRLPSQSTFGNSFRRLVDRSSEPGDHHWRGIFSVSMGVLVCWDRT
jgi:hypothetical protein